MSSLRALRAGLRRLFRKSAVERDLDDEVRDYLAAAIDEHIRAGRTPEEAARLARLDLGGIEAMKEHVRSGGWDALVETVARDVRWGARALRRTPGFTLVACVTLAVGIGATTAIFSAVNPILFEPLPYPQAERVVLISDRASGGRRVDTTYGTFTEISQRARSFEVMGVGDGWQAVLTGSGEPERLVAQRVSAGYFRALGTAPAVGRDFADADLLSSAPRVALLGAGLVDRRFGGDRGIVGRTVTLNGLEYLVIGVMPAGFDNVLAPSAEIWAPLKYRAPAPFDGPEWGHHVQTVARLRAGVSLDQARRDVDAIARAPIPEFARPGWADMSGGMTVDRLQDDVTADVRPALVAIVGAVLLVLAIACVNVTNLLLARSTERRSELAMRAALGAGRARLIRQLLTESVLLGAVGGLLGLAVAAFGVRALVALSPPGLPRVGAIRLDTAAFAFALGVTVLIGIAVGLAPALQFSRGDLTRGVQQSSQRTTRGHRLTRHALVVAEVALALVLLVGSGLIWRSLTGLLAVPTGFEASHVLTMRVQPAGQQRTDAARSQLFKEALDAVRAVPGVEAAGFTSQLPLSGDVDKYGARFESAREDPPDQDGSAFRYAVTPGYVDAMRIPLRRGRLLDAHDTPGAPEAVLISESFAKRRFPGRNPVGQRVRFGPETADPDRPWDVIVGVVGDVKQASLALGQPDAFYVVVDQWVWVDNAMSLVVRTRGDATALVAPVKRAIWSVDREQSIERVETMDDLVLRSEAERRFVLTVLGAFALAALLLAAIGVYGILSGSVAERAREIGVRAALGASPVEILMLVVQQGVTLTAMGAALGVVAAAIASRAVLALLFGVSRLDPATYLGVVLILGAVSMLACALPAWRAARIDPMVTLRAE
ncbi:MAG TPA: ABC transporter permease [Vicinamibacterales bacterium]|nr:ABC transporter permease [Vicinamibacterales bacterium]